MNPQPKPVKVVRASRPLKRSTIKRRPRGVDKPKSRTSKRRKSQKITAKKCYDLWSKFVRSRAGWRCELLGENFSGYIHAQCNGPLQGMHGFKRSAHPSVRYAAWNGVSGCSGIHRYLSGREVVWHRWLREKWGAEVYEQRYALAVATQKYDLKLVAETYRTALGELTVE